MKKGLQVYDIKKRMYEDQWKMCLVNLLDFTVDNHAVEIMHICDVMKCFCLKQAITNCAQNAKVVLSHFTAYLCHFHGVCSHQS